MPTTKLTPAMADMLDQIAGGERKEDGWVLEPSLEWRNEHTIAALHRRGLIERSHGTWFHLPVQAVRLTVAEAV